MNLWLDLALDIAFFFAVSFLYLRIGRFMGKTEIRRRLINMLMAITQMEDGKREQWERDYLSHVFDWTLDIVNNLEDEVMRDHPVLTTVMGIRPKLNVERVPPREDSQAR